MERRYLNLTVVRQNGLNKLCDLGSYRERYFDNFDIEVVNPKGKVDFRVIYNDGKIAIEHNGCIKEVIQYNWSKKGIL